MGFKDFLADETLCEEDSAVMKKAKLKVKLAKLKLTLKDMSVTPHSQREADAIDDVRDEIKDVEAELKSLKENMNYDASTAYTSRVEEVKQLLADITRLVDQHGQQQSGSPSWGFAGDMAHVAEQLTEIKTFLTDGKQ
jgi:uncharacterized protein YukE